MQHPIPPVSHLSAPVGKPRRPVVSRVIILGFLLASQAARAAEGEGCAGGAWPLDAARAALAAAQTHVANGAQLPAAEGAFLVDLVPLADAGLPSPPTRLPAEGVKFAGFLLLPAPAVAGRIEVSLSEAGWVDLVQDGKSLPAVAFTGVKGCPGLRKSVRFEVTQRPLVLQLSGVSVDRLKVALAPVP
ncbi:hypothetical protein [Roseixanthobacter glucoisosaccharinicivorans]|uniref:hypothetical protein n=1 Tax=Roseixanthobacter glucoisosaccharinicivorans TaxID=3119923 RepID=UPI0037266AAA